MKYKIIRTDFLWSFIENLQQGMYVDLKWLTKDNISVSLTLGLYSEFMLSLKREFFEE